MVTFKNNNRRSNFRRVERNFKGGSSDKTKFNNQFGNIENFQRKSPNRNNQNAYKLFEKYNNLARETLSSGDKILSENYFQHADHFKRILNEQEVFKKEKIKNLEKKDSETAEVISSVEKNHSNESKNKDNLQQDINQN